MFEVPQFVFDTYNAAVDAMIDVNFGVTCSIVYPNVQSPCSNCRQDTMTGKSANVYLNGGPIPFTQGLCPYCNGDGFLITNSSEDIKLRCYFTPKHWLKLPVDAKIPEGAMQTFGYLTDLPKIRNAQYLLVNTPEGGYGEYKYKLFAEPVIHGFQKNRYFMAFWSKDR